MILTSSRFAQSHPAFPGGQPLEPTQVHAALEPLANSWLDTPITQRGLAKGRNVLGALKDQIASHLMDWTQALHRDTLRPLAACRTEVLRSLQTLEATIAASHSFPTHEGKDWTEALQGGHQATVQRHPIGPVFAITPFNFPLNLTLHKWAPAQVLGLPVVIKPPLTCPQTFLLLEEAFTETQKICPDMAPWALLFAENEELGTWLSREDFPTLTFTGSQSVGLELKRLHTHKNLILELGSTAAAVVLRDLTPATSGGSSPALDALVQSAFGNSGQSCISLQHILIKAAHKTAFLNAFMARAKDSLRDRSLSNPQALCTGVHTSAAKTRLDALKAKLQGHLSGVWHDLSALEPTNPWDVPPFIWDAGAALFEPGPKEAYEHEELFGPGVFLHTIPPALDAAPPHELKAALSPALRRLDAGLHLSVFTNDFKEAQGIFAATRSRSVLWEEVPSWRSDAMPYGGGVPSAKGPNHSGVWGSEGPYETLMSYTFPRHFVWPSLS